MPAVCADAMVCMRCAGCDACQCALALCRLGLAARPQTTTHMHYKYFSETYSDPHSLSLYAARGFNRTWWGGVRSRPSERLSPGLLKEMFGDDAEMEHFLMPHVVMKTVFWRPCTSWTRTTTTCTTTPFGRTAAPTASRVRHALGVVNTGGLTV